MTTAVDLLRSLALTLAGLSFVMTALFGFFCVLMFVVALTQLQLFLADDGSGAVDPK